MPGHDAPPPDRDASTPRGALDDVVGATRAAAWGERVEPLEFRLRDGSRALLRPIRPDDADRLREGVRLLSPRSRYLRFHAPVPRLTAEQARYLARVDHVNHVAWVALDPAHPEHPGTGVARYVRLEPDTVAEAAVTVVDEYQGRGLGTLLLAVIGTVAAADGIRVFRNWVLDANDAMLDLLDELGATRTYEGDRVWRVELPLAGEPDALPRSPAGLAIRALARPVPDRHGRFSLLFPSVWLRRRP